MRNRILRNNQRTRSDNENLAQTHFVNLCFKANFLKQLQE